MVCPVGSLPRRSPFAADQSRVTRKQPERGIHHPSPSSLEDAPSRRACRPSEEPRARPHNKHISLISDLIQDQKQDTDETIWTLLPSPPSVHRTPEQPLNRHPQRSHGATPIGNASLRSPQSPLGTAGDRWRPLHQDRTAPLLTYRAGPRGVNASRRPTPWPSTSKPAWTTETPRGRPNRRLNNLTQDQTLVSSSVPAENRGSACRLARPDLPRAALSKPDAQAGEPPTGQPKTLRPEGCQRLNHQHPRI